MLDSSLKIPPMSCDSGNYNWTASRENTTEVSSPATFRLALNIDVQKIAFSVTLASEGIFSSKAENGFFDPTAIKFSMWSDCGYICFSLIRAVVSP